MATNLIIDVGGKLDRPVVFNCNEPVNVLFVKRRKKAEAFSVDPTDYKFVANHDVYAFEEGEELCTDEVLAEWRAKVKRD